ncbi:MAG TPA: flagellar biosynthetic protein FliQ [Anaeromyxobacter sp.]|nr:flagellar biosynthetic protein FliQ [Anaeromyxobacter sp.]
MTLDLPGALVHEALLVLASVGGPVLGALLAVGLTMGILQAATQVNDAAVGFLPRAAAGAAVIWLFGGWIMERLSAFLVLCISRMPMR